MVATSRAPSTFSTARLMRLVTVAAVAVALILAVIKAVAWFWTGSVSMLASLVDSSLDLGASALNLIAVRHALMPADHEHRFGHGKAEAIAGLAQGAIIAGSAAFLLFQSLDRLIEPRPVVAETAGIIVMAISIALTLALVLFQRYVVRLSGSLAISADNLHYVGDLAMNLAVIAALVVSGYFGIHAADGAFGLAISLVVAWGAWRIVEAAYNQLMDREFGDAERERIKAIVREHPEVRAMHDLRTRMAGSAFFIQFHIELDPDITLSRAHEISDEVESAVLKAFPGADLIVHQDPAGAEMHPILAHS